jgi:hypothetical protein
MYKKPGSASVTVQGDFIMLDIKKLELEYIIYRADKIGVIVPIIVLKS